MTSFRRLATIQAVSSKSPAPASWGGELKYLVQQPIEGFGNEREAQGLEEGDQHEEHEQGEHPPAHPSLDINPRDAFLPRYRAGQAVGQACAAKSSTYDGRHS